MLGFILFHMMGSCEGNIILSSSHLYQQIWSGEQNLNVKVLLTLVHCRPGVALWSLPWPWGQSRWAWCRALFWGCQLCAMMSLNGDWCWPTNFVSGLCIYLSKYKLVFLITRLWIRQVDIIKWALLKNNIINSIRKFVKGVIICSMKHAYSSIKCHDYLSKQLTRTSQCLFLFIIYRFSVFWLMYLAIDQGWDIFAQDQTKLNFITHLWTVPCQLRQL